MLITAGVLIFLYQLDQLSEHEEIIGQANENVALKLMNSLDDRIDNLVTSSRGLKGQALIANADISSFPDARKIVREYGILKLKIYNQSGTAIYSTAREDIGGKSQHPDFLAKALSGGITHKIESRENFPGADGAIKDVHVALTYMPLTHEGKRIGAIEIYDDATPLITQINNKSIRIALIIFSAFAALYAALFFYVRENDLKIVKWHEQIHNLAFYDALTGLPNRRLLSDRLEHTKAVSNRTGRYAALLFLDLDNFKSLNDEYGHDVGDLLLQEAARRISSCVREVDTVARFGGDEFVVILGELVADKAESTSQAGVVAEKIRATLADRYVLKVHRAGKTETTVEHQCTSSIGVVLFANLDGSVADVVKKADVAMYQAKAEGPNMIRFYDAKI
jgi:diguanylate cyclase (GGDEF)-like protein